MPELECAPNFRDLGGLPTRDGAVLSRGRLFRSDMVSRPTAQDESILAACRIGLVLDLRSAAEANSHPNTYWRKRGVEVISFDVGTDVRAKGSFWERLRADISPASIEELMHSVYRSIPHAVAPALRTLFDRLVEGTPVTLIHCTAGKDRTGVAVALLLHALGVTTDAIAADYLETCARIGDREIARAQRLFSEIAGRRLDDASLRFLTHADMAFLQQSFDHIERKFGGLDTFLERQAGLDDAKLTRLREVLVVREVLVPNAPVPADRRLAN